MLRRKFLALSSTVVLTSCASGGPKLTTQTVDLKRVAYLPIKEYPATAEAGPFNSIMVASAPSYGTTAPPINPTMLGIAIGQALRASSDASAAASRSSIARALADLAINPKVILHDALTTQLTNRGCPVEEFTDVRASEPARTDWNFSKLPSEFDAVLDVQLVYAGYFPDKENKGFSPQIYATSQLLHTAGKGTRLERFQYESDFRSAEGDSRFFTAPKLLTVSSLAQIAEQAQFIRYGVTALLLLMAEKMADDVDRAVKKLPRLK
jgi:hypothetical protein